MAAVTRTEAPDVQAITTKDLVIERGENQVFYETGKSWELWQVQPLLFLKRWSKKHIFWVLPGVTP
jgi:hypothetical protein